MRAALWLLALFGVAVAAALFAGNNQGTVTLYWPPYRVDLSLNLVVLLLVADSPRCMRPFGPWQPCWHCPTRPAAGACSKKNAPCTMRCWTR